MPTTPSKEAPVNLLALSGGGFKALAADAGMFAGLINYFGIDVSGLLHDDLAISANSGSTWFTNLLAYSQPFVNSLNDYENLFRTDVNLDELTVGEADGFFGVMGEAYDKYLFGYFTGDALERLLAGVDSVPQFISFLTAKPGNFARFLAACSLDGGLSLIGLLDQKLTGKLGYETFREVLTSFTSALGSSGILPYVGALSVAMMEGIDWNGFMQKVVYAPPVDRLLQNVNFYSGDGRTEALSTQSLIYQLAILSDDATVAPLSPQLSDGLVTVSVTNNEAKYGGLFKNVYNFLPASATSLGNSSQRPAPWLPNIQSGDLSVEYDSPAFFDAENRTYIDLNFKGLSAFLASSISSSAGALGQSIGVINDIDSVFGLFFNALDLLSDPSATNVLATFTKGLAPLVQARKQANGSWTAGDPAYGISNYSDPVNTLSTADAAKQAYLRMADGGYFDNSSVTSGLSYLSANQSSWRANDGIKDFDVTLFVFSSEAEQISSTLVQRGFDQIGNVAQRLFTGGNPQEFKLLGADLIDVSHPSSAIFDSTRTSGNAAPIWSYQAPDSATGVAKGFAIKAYDMYTTTADNNNMRIAGGYEGSLKLWNIVSPTGPIPLATAGSWSDYEVMYHQIIEGLQAKDDNGIAGAQILGSQLKIEGVPTGISISKTVASKGTVAGTVIGMFSTTDPDAADTFSYQLVKGKGDDDNAIFEVQADQLIASVGLGFENKTRYLVRVRSTDPKGLWTERQFNIQPPAVQAGPVRGATVFFDERTYLGNSLAANCNLIADSGESVAISDGLGQYAFESLPDPEIVGNRDGILDWKDGMVMVGGLPDFDGRIQLIDSIAGINLGFPLVGLPGESISILTTLKYAALVRWRPEMRFAGQPLTPELITQYFSRIIRDVPTALQNDSFNPYSKLFDEDLSERKQALDSLVFAYSNLAVVKTVMALFEQLDLDYSSPEALAMWGYVPEPQRADRPEIIAFSAYGTAISNRFGSAAAANPADPFQRPAFAEQYDLADQSHLRTVLKEILAVYPLRGVLAEASQDPLVPQALNNERTLAEALLVDQFLEQKFGLLLDKLSEGLEQIVAVVDSRLRESAALGEEHIIASISGSKRTMVESLASELVALAVDPTIDTIAAFDNQFLPLFYRPLFVDATDRTFDYWLSLSAADDPTSSVVWLSESVGSEPQELSLLLNLHSLQGQAQPAPDSGLSVRFVVGGRAVEGQDYELGQQLADRTIWIPSGTSQLRLPIRILNPDLFRDGRSLSVQLLSADSGFGVNLDRSVVHINFPGTAEVLAASPLSGAPRSFIPTLLVSQPDPQGVIRAPLRESGNWVLQGQGGVADRFLLTAPQEGVGLPHVSSFKPEDGDTLMVDPSAFPGAKITDFNTYGGLVFHVPTGTPMALISDQSPSGTDQAWSALSSYAGYFGFADYQPVLLRSGPEGVLSSAATQSLLFQALTPADRRVDIGIGDSLTTLTAFAPQANAWTNALAQQTLQADFDSARVRALDGHRQGSIVEALVPEQAALDISINSQPAIIVDLEKGNDIGFSDFGNSDGNLHVARPVVLAVTPQGGDNIRATVKLRQNGANSQSLFLYQVDDLTGLVNGIAPGENGYEDVVHSRLYSFQDGHANLQGPGFGNYLETQVLGVDAGDLIAMGLVNHDSGHVFYGFSQANEKVGGQPVQHLWSYGNGTPTYGFEDTYAGGDADFNDSVFSLIFSNPPV